MQHATIVDRQARGQLEGLEVRGVEPHVNQSPGGLQHGLLSAKVRRVIDHVGGGCGATVLLVLIFLLIIICSDGRDACSSSTVTKVCLQVGRQAAEHGCASGHLVSARHRRRRWGRLRLRRLRLRCSTSSRIDTWWRMEQPQASKGTCTGIVEGVDGLLRLKRPLFPVDLPHRPTQLLIELKIGVAELEDRLEARAVPGGNAQDVHAQ